MNIEELKNVIKEEVKATMLPEFEKLKQPLENKLLQASIPSQKNWISNKVHMTQEGVEKTIKYFRALVSGDRAELKTLTEGTGSAGGGGYLVPDEFKNEVIRLIPEYGVFRKNCRVIPMKHMTLKMPKSGTDVSAVHTDEGSKKTEGNTSFGQVELIAKKVAKIEPFSEELFEDADIDIVQYLMELYAEAFALREDQDGFLGDGTATYGGIKGIAGADDVIVVTLAGDSYVANMDAGKLLEMQSGLRSGALRNAKYYMHNNVLNAIRNLKDKNGQYIYQQPSGPDTAILWGKAVVVADSLPSTDAPASPFVFFGNLENAILGDRQQISSKILDQATLTTAGNLAEKDLLALRVVERYDIQIPFGDAFSVLKTSA